MEMNLFAQKVVNALNEKFDGQYTFDSQDVLKTNGINLRGIYAQVEDGITPVVYIDKYLLDYRMGKGFDVITAEIASEYLEAMRIAPVRFDEDQLLDGDRARSKLLAKLVNYDLNKEMLQSVPHRRIDDYAIIPIMDIDYGNGTGEVKFTKEQFEKFGWDENEVIDEAFNRTVTECPAVISYMSELAFGMGDSANLLKEDIEGAVEGLLVVTNTTSCDGAIALYYPEVKEWFDQHINGDFYIIPSSIHEVLIIPNGKGADISSLTAMLLSVNGAMVADNEVLGTRALRYDKKAGCFVS